MATWTGTGRYIPLLGLLLFLSGCASKPAGDLFDPVAPSAHSWDPIVRVLADGKLRLTLRILGKEEMQQQLGVDLTQRRIRGLWIEIDNQTDTSWWLLRSSLDWDYYPVSEILYSLAASHGERSEGW
ncbi:hypothetical protein [Thiolapillus sp.]|uniref:hypothetical protein n=1 Tax=Thiolapillus sp. TaxID=2017437 RepID=UPI003AF750B1